MSEDGEIFENLRNKYFPEFIDFILNEWKSHQCNPHWQPQYMRCNYCEINYDVVGRVENLEEDIKYIAHINNFTSSLPKNEWHFHVHPSGIKQFTSPKHIQQNKLMDSKRKEEKAIKYFSLLTSDQINGLHNMYQIDFEIFGYSEYPFVKHDKNG